MFSKLIHYLSKVRTIGPQNFQLNFKDKLFFIILFIIYILYLLLLIQPNRFSYFSLIDDGQTLVNSMDIMRCVKNFDCSNIPNIIFEKEFGRVRPFYWFLQFLLYLVLGTNSYYHHLVRLLLLGFTTIMLMSYFMTRLSVSKINQLYFILLFLVNISFTENLIRLGPIEPMQLLVLLFLTLILFNKVKFRKAITYYSSLFVVSTLSILTKETSIFMVVPVTVYLLFSNKGKINFTELLIVITPMLFFTVIGRLYNNLINKDLALYTDNFQLNISTIVENVLSYFQMFLNMTQPFIKVGILIVIMSFVVDRKKVIKRIVNPELIYWVLFFLSSFIILTPWNYILERYTLVALFGLIIVLSQIFSIFSSSVFKLREGTYFNILITVIYLIIMTNLIFKGAPIELTKSINYMKWFEIHTKYEYEQVRELSKLDADIIYINALPTLNTWEVCYEIPLHLSLFYEPKKIKLLNEDAMADLHGKYVFSTFERDYFINSSLLKDMSPAYTNEKKIYCITI